MGEFEELVLTMVGVSIRFVILQDEAYAIVNEIRERLGRDANLSAVHVTLYRPCQVADGRGYANARREAQAHFLRHQRWPGHVAGHEGSADGPVETHTAVEDEWGMSAGLSGNFREVRPGFRSETNRQGYMTPISQCRVNFPEVVQSSICQFPIF